MVFVNLEGQHGSQVAFILVCAERCPTQKKCVWGEEDESSSSSEETESSGAEGATMICVGRAQVAPRTFLRRCLVMWKLVPSSAGIARRLSSPGWWKKRKGFAVDGAVRLHLEENLTSGARTFSGVLCNFLSILGAETLLVRSLGGCIRLHLPLEGPVATS